MSLFKETQVVDILAMGQDQNEELLWSVVAALHVDLGKPILWGPIWAKTLPTRQTEIWALSPTLPPLKNPLIPRRDPFLFHFINQAGKDEEVHLA